MKAEESRNAAINFMNDYEARGITIDGQSQMIAALQRVTDEQSTRIDLLTKRAETAEASEAIWMMHSVELATQIRSMVETSKRALSIADQVAQALADKQGVAKASKAQQPLFVATDEQVAELLKGFSDRLNATSEPLPMPSETDGTTAATRMLMDMSPSMKPWPSDGPPILIDAGTMPDPPLPTSVYVPHPPHSQPGLPPLDDDNEPVPAFLTAPR